MSVREGREPVFGRLGLVRPAIRSAAILRLCARFSRSSRWATRTRSRAKREVSQSAEPSRHVIVCQAASGRPRASALTETGWCSGSRRIRLVGRPRPDQAFGGSGPVPGRPDRGVRLNAGDIGQAERGDLGAQLACRCHSRRPSAPRPAAGRPRTAARICSSAISGLVAKPIVLGTPALSRRVGIGRPVFRQIEPIGHWQAGGVVGQRQRHRHLAIVLLAELAAILPRHADRVPPLLGKAGIVDDPRLDRPAAARSPAAPSRAPWPAPARPTTAPCRQNAAATGAAPPPAPAPSPPPSAPRSCARRASAARGSNPAAAPPDRHGRSRRQAPST